MPAANSETTQLLSRWHAGDRNALDRLLVRDLAWVEDLVRRRMGPTLRSKEETQDIVQGAVVEILEYGPRFVIADQDEFRGLLARMVENNLRDKNDWYNAQRRAAHRESPIHSESVLDLDQSRLATTPSVAADRRERDAWIRLALELLEAEDRSVILLREYEGLGFAAIGEQLGVSESAAKMRFHRALPRLAVQVDRLRSGKF